MMNFSHLPVEVQLAIFNYLDTSSLMVAKQVSGEWKTNIEDAIFDHLALSQMCIPILKESLPEIRFKSLLLKDVSAPNIPLANLDQISTIAVSNVNPRCFSRLMRRANGVKKLSVIKKTDEWYSNVQRGSLPVRIAFNLRHLEFDVSANRVGRPERSLIFDLLSIMNGEYENLHTLKLSVNLQSPYRIFSAALFFSFLSYMPKLIDLQLFEKSAAKEVSPSNYVTIFGMYGEELTEEEKNYMKEMRIRFIKASIHASDEDKWRLLLTNQQCLEEFYVQCAIRNEYLSQEFLQDVFTKNYFTLRKIRCEIPQGEPFDCSMLKTLLRLEELILIQRLSRDIDNEHETLLNLGSIPKSTKKLVLHNFVIQPENILKLSMLSELEELQIINRLYTIDVETLVRLLSLPSLRMITLGAVFYDEDQMEKFQDNIQELLIGRRPFVSLKIRKNRTGSELMLVDDINFEY